MAGNLKLDESRALVTGASGGIGKAIARALAARGSHVLLTGRNQDALSSLASELPSAEPLSADLADRDALERLIGLAGRVDVLVANAGLPGSGRYDSFTPGEIDHALDVNLRAPMQLARALAPAMVERGMGHLVFISSLSGKIAMSGSAVYSGTKFGLRGFAAGLRQDLRGTGVGVTTVFPGPISDAGMWADAGMDLPRGAATRSPEQVAEAVLRGVARDKAEIDVAQLMQRLGGWVAGFAPETVAALNRRLGGERTAAELAERQRVKR